MENQPKLTKAEFIRQVREASAKLERAIEKANPQQMLQPGAAGDWTMKDVMAHITWHEEQMLEVLRQRALVGSEWWNWPTDRRNQAIYEQFRDEPLDGVLKRFKEIYPQLLVELEALSDEDLNEAARFAEMPPDWRPGDVLADNTYEHYLDHVRDLTVK